MSQRDESGGTTAAATSGIDDGRARDRAVHPVLAALLWLWVLVPFGYGVYQLIIKIPALFGA